MKAIENNSPDNRGQKEGSSTGASWPIEGLEFLGACPNCGSKSRELLHEDLGDLVFYSAPGKWRLYCCRQCQSAYLDPRPNQETIGQAYKSYFTHGSPEDRTKTALRGFLRSLANGYRNRRYGGCRSPAYRAGYWVIRFLNPVAALLDRLMRHMPRVDDREKKLLDVGSGNGQFLLDAQKTGWRATGLELDPKAVAVSRALGLHVIHGGIEMMDDFENEFDVITLSHVIEHLHNPRSAIEACFRALKPGGMLWLETPNIGSLGHKLYGRWWRGLEPPRHLVIFSRDALANLLMQAGFVDLRQHSAPLTAWYMVSECEKIKVREMKGAGGPNDPGSGKILRRALGELVEGFVPHAREFLTLAAKKPE